MFFSFLKGIIFVFLIQKTRTIPLTLITYKLVPNTAVPVLSCRRRHWGPSTSLMNLRTSSCTRLAACSISIATTFSTVTVVRTTRAPWRTEGTPGCWGPNHETLRSLRCTQAGPGETGGQHSQWPAVPLPVNTPSVHSVRFQVNVLTCCVSGRAQLLSLCPCLRAARQPLSSLRSSVSWTDRYDCPPQVD